MERALRVLRTASIWASFLSTSAQALADDSPTQEAQTTKAGADSEARSVAAISSAHALPNSEELAAAAYRSALESYAKGDVAAALNGMRESYRLSHRAELLFNVAQLEDELKACRDALADYTQYLELVPNGRYRGSAAQAQQRLAQVCPPPAPTAPPPSPMPESEGGHAESIPDADQGGYWTTPRAIGWSTIAAGTISGAIAVYFELEAIQARDDFQQSVDAAIAGGPAADKSLQDRQHRYNEMAIAFGIAGGAMVTTGALLLVIDPGKTGQRTQSASLCAFPGLVGASYIRRF